MKELNEKDFLEKIERIIELWYLKFKKKITNPCLKCGSDTPHNLGFAKEQLKRTLIILCALEGKE